MKYLFSLFSFSLIVSSCAVLNNSSLETAELFTINGTPTISDEFIYVYEKNNFNNDSLYYPADIDAYFELFVNFKLKVEAAKSAGIDTSRSFLEEYKTYKDQLIRPYLSETREQERLVAEAYERMKYELDASHILITVDQNAAPEDTLTAYGRIVEIHQKARKGEDFGQLAVTYSEDPSAKSNMGRLGYFTAFQMVYAFEDAAYKTPVDSISDILRSRFGYHILKVHDKRPFSGQVKVSHIMVTNQNGTLDEQTMKNKIFEIHDQIARGADWNELCRKFSDDQRTKNDGGTLPFIGLRQINDDAFENVAFGLKNPGDISDPVRSRFGWHIIRLDEKQGLQPFEQMEEDLKQKVAKDERALKSKKAVIANLKQLNNFKMNENGRAVLIDLADSTLLTGNWQPVLADSTLQKPVFSIGENAYKIGGISKDFQARQRRRTGISPDQYMQELLDNYIEVCLIDNEERQLVKTNRDFRMLLNEYYEGILLFEIMNEKVWGKAVEDTVGMKSYFENNRGKYVWGPRVDAVIFQTGNKDIVTSIKRTIENKPYELYQLSINSNTNLVNDPGLDTLMMLYQKYDQSTISLFSKEVHVDQNAGKNKLSGGSGKAENGSLKTALLQYFKNFNVSDEDIKFGTVDDNANNIEVRLNSNSKKSLEFLYNKESALNLLVDEGLFEKGTNQIVDALTWEKGMQELEIDGSFYLVVFEDILDPQPKELTKVRGTVISDYQNYLEKTWIQELKTTYKVEINEHTLDQIKTTFKKKLHSPD
jgi:peptidyl-prolyl cis-trans isomerase SurA